MKKINNLPFVLSLFMACFSSVQLHAQVNDTLKQSVDELKKTVDPLKKLKITGWVQFQYQWAESKGADNIDGGAFAAQSNQRFMVRRGRVKFTYSQKLSQFALQINATERGVNLVDVFAKITDPWTKSISLTAGVMNRPFGFEIEQSSSVRETPERSRYTQVLMPNERDLGFKITYEPVSTHPLHGLKLDAGFYNGQGIAVPGTSSLTGPFVNDGVNEFDYIKDFIGRLSYYRDSKNGKNRYGIGASHYNGGIVNQSNVVYDHYITDINGIAFAAADTLNGQRYKDKASSRKYVGAELFFSTKSALGTTTLRGEYIFGTQPGSIDNTRSVTSLPSKKATYLREFDGAYAYLIQRIGKSKHEVALKYEWYDPNSSLSGKAINSVNGMTKAEVRFSTLGLGYNYYMDENVKFMFYYNMVTNESTQVSGYTGDLADNILTIRMQYRF